ncbi:MarR family transcriptional regulator [Dactylosporangium sp. NPDC049525]|uniref:MarR family winged helix-turn-helix transcriptional regulator n=1 Tax=Dactylosporangium sp. NPDC049525 TaxID=3154730 RepID=UPI00344077C0
MDQQLHFVLSVATRNVVAIYRPLLATVNLTPTQYLAMLALWQHGPLSVHGLGQVLELDSGTLSPLLKRLEACGYVRRERDTADERSVIVTVTVTVEGNALRARAASIPSAVRDQFGMPMEEMEHLIAVLATVIAATRPAPAA